VNVTLGVSDTLVCVICVAYNQICFYSVPTKAAIVVRPYTVFHNLWALLQEVIS